MKIGATWSGVAFAVVLSGCATVIHPPREPADARTVFLLEKAGHASLVLPDETGALTGYSYGDRNWYALDEMNPWTAVAALCWPTRAVLGRRTLSGTELSWSDADELHQVRVERHKVARLQARLEAVFRENDHTKVVNALRGLFLVEHPLPYTASHNSNSVAADWLEELGCGVSRGWTLLGKWEVRPAGEGHPEGAGRCQMRRPSLYTSRTR